MTLVAGVDGYKQGWVAVVLEDGSFRDALVFESIGTLLATLASAKVVGVDMPIGLPVSSPRRGEAAARALVGPRRSSVFATPPRAVLEAATYTEARQVARDQFGIGVSSQMYRGLRDKIFEVDDARQSDDRLIEVHPEVSFRALAEHELSYSKRTWNGQMERRRLLEGAGIVLPDDLSGAGEVPVDDVLDAAVVAWTARRHARGKAHSLPDPPETDDRGRDMAIWY